jgi:DNA polymerase-3 subunit chi
MLDGQDAAAVAAGRQRWAGYKEAGHSLVYYQQDENGRWQEKARG